ncbi:MAG: tetratricopeptide repeat protein [Alphaproteobacteria bacterium]|nr:tetratricopeptide repeat protein [Alphaproteobacteria bacterium]
MFNWMMLGLPAGLLVIVLWHTNADAQQEVWERHIRASGAAYQRGRFEEAISHGEAALEAAKNLDRDGIRVAETLIIVADIYKNQRRFGEAEPLYEKALAIEEELLGPEHPDLADKFGNLAELNRNQGNYAQAEQFYKRALKIDQKALGQAHPHVALGLHNLALFYQSQSNHSEAEALFKQSLAIWEQALGSGHPILAKGLENYAALLRQSGQPEAAEKAETRANEIRLDYVGHPR